MVEKRERDYRLNGAESILAIQNGLADATWYTSPVEKDKMRELLKRKDGPAIRDTVLWFSLIFGSGYLVYVLWGTIWFVLPYIVYSVLYASTSDSRWHESSHGTAFKTDWMNSVLYEIASFMVMRESTPWRWSHTRHHSDTIIRGRDPEIAVPRPPDIKGIFLMFFAVRSAPSFFRKIFIHAFGKIDNQEKSYIPQSEYGKVFFKARIYILIFLAVIILAIWMGSILPLMFIGIPTFVGTWLMPIYGLTQHAGLAENVLDHRLNCRTVYMNRIHRYLYWNMNYHVEHHMFPLVPYHALPRLHELIKDDCPKPYKSIVDAFKEIIPTIKNQVKNPEYYAERKLPSNSFDSKKQHINRIIGDKNKIDENGLIEICAIDEIQNEEVLRFDFGEKTFAIYHTIKGKFYASDGICTHGNTHLSEGFVQGNIVECPKHNGRFNITDGSPQRLPVCVGLKTYKVVPQNGMLFLQIEPVTTKKTTTREKPFEFKVVSNLSITPFVKELKLQAKTNIFDYKPGQYIQLEIPPCEILFEEIEINKPFQNVWKELNLFGYHMKNEIFTRRNYSMASNPEKNKILCFNVRLATPPPGLNCNAGVGSSYVFSLKPGDEVKAYGPQGNFCIKKSKKEIVYIGGGAGMAPIKSHISYLFETLKTKNKVSFWYGARRKSDIYYHEYFEKLASENDNFSFHIALSEPGEKDNWKSHTGFIHEVVEQEFLSNKGEFNNMEFYLCGPPAMVESTNGMLQKIGISKNQISFDAF